MSDQFNSVSVTKKAHVYFNGASISRVIILKDGTKKTIGVILPTKELLTFKTHTPERIEIISGQCRVQIANQSDLLTYYSGDSFSIPADSHFKIISDTIINYVCHFE
ncbi:pyrimidine/purine nucleoside phosphorylase [Acinetobacter baumannii]|uniref:pyrimidine/purine nucleoside phosphorylase n=1 Tax=Acinetobacter baumannii TaxID=470 RepID=UPI0038B68F2A